MSRDLCFSDVLSDVSSYVLLDMCLAHVFMTSPATRLGGRSNGGGWDYVHVKALHAHAYPAQSQLEQLLLAVLVPA
jgi:hypothetical protein